MSKENNTFDSLDMSTEEFRKLGYKVVDMMTEYYSGIRDYSVFPKKTSEEIEQEFSEKFPEEAQDPYSILDEWRSKVLPNTIHPGSPSLSEVIVES